MKVRILFSLAFGSIAANLVAAPAFAAGYYSSDSSGVPVVVEVRGGARPDQMEPDMFGKPADALAGWCAGHATLPLTFAFSRPVALDRMLVKSRGAAIRVEGDGELLIKFQPGRDRDEDLKGVPAKT